MPSSSTHSVSGRMSPASSASGRNLIGGSSPSLGCSHRTQRLDRQHLAAAKVELRLVVEHEVTPVDRRSQLLEEPHLVPVLVEVRLVDGERRLAELGPVHGHIGAPDEAGAVCGVGGRHGDADAGADAGADHVQHERLLEALGEPLCDRRGVVGVPVDQHDGELVTTDADEQVGVSQRSHEPWRRAASRARRRPGARRSR